MGWGPGVTQRQEVTSVLAAGNCRVTLLKPLGDRFQLCEQPRTAQIAIRTP